MPSITPAAPRSRLLAAAIGLTVLPVLAACGQASSSSAGTGNPSSTSTPGSTSASSGTSGSPASPPTAPRSPASTGSAGSPSGTAAAAPKSTPSAPSGTADLTIAVNDGAGMTTTWHLTCNPPGGTHPHPAVACGVLGANGAKALPRVRVGIMCTQLYGGPQKAQITGTWRGQQVDSKLSRVNGCEVARWNLLLGLLPAGSGAESQLKG